MFLRIKLSVSNVLKQPFFPFIVMLCHAAPVILNGKRSSSNYHAGAVITYTCNDGYKLVGKSKLTCQSDQKWSDPAPRCIRM
jgi:CUB/sushi domain-containing protein